MVESLEDCVSHCDKASKERGYELYSVSLDLDWWESCCCHDQNSCRCSNTAEVSVEVAMVNGHAFPTDACPISHLAGGYITEECRPFQYFSEKNLGKMKYTALVWHLLNKLYLLCLHT